MYQCVQICLQKYHNLMPQETTAFDLLLKGEVYHFCSTGSNNNNYYLE